MLEQSSKTFQDIYSIVFSNKDKVFFECPTMTRKVTYTYAQAEKQIEHIAQAISKTVSTRGEFIGLHGENSPEWVIAFWAILRSGNKPYLINLKQPTAFTESILQTLKANCVIVLNENTEYSINTVSYSILKNAKVESQTVAPCFSNEFAISTSGTTLKEKICIYNGAQISEQILNLRTIVKTNKHIIGNCNGVIKQLAFLPFYHIFGFEAVLMWYSFFGSTFVFLNDYAPENILRTVRNHEVTHIFSVPILWHAVEKSIKKELSQENEKTRKKFEKAAKVSIKLQNAFPYIGKKIAALIFRDIRYKLFGESIRFCISGGSYVKPSAVELLNAVGYPLCNGYGMTEIGICSVELSDKPKDRILCSIGKPFDSLEYMVGADGDLLVKGSSVCPKIIIDKASVACNNDWFDTGDIVSFAEDGRYYINGRHSDVVFSENGENLNPDLAEKSFSIRDVIEFSVLGNQDNTKLMLIVHVPRGLIAEQKERIKQDIELGNSLLPSAYRVHDVWYTYDLLKPSGSFKISRSYLKSAISRNDIVLFRSLDEQISVEGTDSELKRIIREAFATVLEIDAAKIGDDMHFMNDLGGTSLDYFTLVNQLDKRFDLRIDFGSDYDFEQFGYTVNHFERLIKELIK